MDQVLHPFTVCWFLEARNKQHVLGSKGISQSLVDARYPGSTTALDHLSLVMYPAQISIFATMVLLHLGQKVALPVVADNPDGASQDLT